MDYTVVMITFNSGEILRKVIDSVLKQTITPKEFIIIDNHSNDGTVGLILNYRKKYPFFKIYQMRIDPGVCKELNLGISMAKMPMILVLDDDAILVENNWMEIGLKNLRDKIVLGWGNPSGILNSMNYGDFFLGCAFIIDKKTFLEVGMFDEKFFLYENDTDLTIRIHKYGYRVLPLKKIGVIHPYGSRGPRYYQFSLSNRLLIYWKYYPYWIAIIMSILHAFRELRAIKNFKLIRYWSKGIKRFFSNLYGIGLSYHNRMGLKEFFQSAYQLKFPVFGYKLVKFLYRI